MSEKQKQPLQKEPPKDQKAASEGLRDDVRVRNGIERGRCTARAATACPT
jgi:hypothetical protein